MTVEDPAALPVRTRSTGALVLGAAILLVALGLRLPITAVGPVLDEMRADLGIGAGLAGVLTSVPVLVFAVASAFVPWLRRRLSLGASISVALALMVVGTILRPHGGATTLLAGTVVVMVGIAIVNVLLPVVVRSGFGGREGWVTGGYVASLQGGAAAGASLTVPVAAALGGWRPALTLWAVVPGVALLAWWPASRGVSASGRRDAASGELATAALWRDRTARALALNFGLQAVVAYIIMGWLPTLLRAEGMPADRAGAMVAVVTLVSIPVSLIAPGWLGGRRDQRAGAWIVTVPWGMAFLGLLVAPVPLAWLWSSLLGVGLSGFSINLALFGLRSATTGDTMRVSTQAQVVGYLAGLPGPLLVGVVAEASGGWDVPLLILLVLLVPMAMTGLVAGEDRHIGSRT